MRYGTSTPAALVERAAEHGQPVLALTDRDGLYGAVKFVQAATAAGIAPVLGVDLAVLAGEPGFRPGSGPAAYGTGSGPAAYGTGTGPAAYATGSGPAAYGTGTGPAAYGTGHGWGSGAPGWRDVPGALGAEGPSSPRVRTPVRGGAERDPRHPRVTVLARGSGAGLPAGVGWASLCRLVTDTHLSGERGQPVTTAVAIARRCAVGDEGGSGPLTVLLGPDSDVGRALLARRSERARALLAAWQRVLPPGALAIEVVCHGGPEGTPASRGHAARMLGLADEAGLPAVLTAAVRHADPGESAVVDVLDAARRLVVLDTRHLDRVTDAAHLASTTAMHAIAREVTSGDSTRADALIAQTLTLAMACAQDARRDLGIGAVHLPEPTSLGIEPGVDPQSVLEQRCRDAILTRYPSAGEHERHTLESRLTDELKVVAELGYPTYFLTVAAVVDLIRDMGVRVAARGSGAGSLVNYLLGISGVDPIRYDLLMERFCSPLRAELPDIDIDVESARRTEVYERILERFGGERVTCVSMMDTYKVRHAVRDVGAALGLPPQEIDEIAKAFPHIRARDARSAIAELPELRSRGLASPRLGLLFDLVEHLDGLPRHIALHPCGVVLSNTGLLDRTPVEASWLGFPMSQFDKDDVETLGLLKLDVLGIRMQSAMAHAVSEAARVDGVGIDLDDHAAGAARRRGDIQADPHHPHPRLLPDREPGPARAHRQVRPGALRGPHHRHLAVPSRAGQVRHDRPVPRGAARLEGRRVPPPHPRARAGGDSRRRGLPRAGAQDRRRDHRRHAGGGRRGAPGHGHAAGADRGRGLVAARCGRARLCAGRCRAHLGGAEVLCLLRVLQGPCRGLRAADLPLGLAEDPPPGGLPGRGADPRPGHVPQAADPRRRPLARHRRARTRCQHLLRHLPGGAGRAVGGAAPADPGPGPLPRGAGTPRPARRARLRHPPVPRRRQGHQRGRGGPNRRRSALLLSCRLLEPCPGLTAGRRAARPRGRVRLALRHELVHQRARPAWPGDPARPAAARQ